MSYYPQYFQVIARNTEQHCGFDSALPLKNSILPPGGNLPPVWQPLHYIKARNFPSGK